MRRKLKAVGSCLLAVGLSVGLCLAEVTLAAEPPITAVAFSPDGRFVVAGSQIGLQIRDWPTLKLQRTVATRLVNIHDLAFATRGDRLAVAGGAPAESGEYEVFSWPNVESLLVGGDHRDTIMSVVWTDESTIATASLDHQIAIWDVASGTTKLRLQGHSAGVAGICFLPNQNTLVSGGLDHNLRIWELQSGQVLRTLNNHTREIAQVASRPLPVGESSDSSDLPLIASIGQDLTLRIWQPTIGRMVRFTRLPAVPFAIAWLPDGTQLATAGSDGRVRVFEPDTVQTVFDLPALETTAYALAAHPSDGSLVVGGRHGSLKRILLPSSTTAP